MPRIAVITPIYNDYAAFSALCRDIGAVAQECCISLSIVAVDDGSLEFPELQDHPKPAGIERIEILRLVCNLGHQRAIAVGLADVVSARDYDAVVVMDCDGEDRPSDIGRLLDAHHLSPTAIIVARRAKRSEGYRFRLFYGIYKSIFATCTGRKIDFGNFMLIPRSRIERLAYMPEVWNHLAAAVLRSRLEIERIPCERGTRYAGRSSMNLVSLLAHGLSAVSVFSDLVFVRLLVFSGAICGLSLFMAGIAIAIRATTDLAIPGWASNVVGISAVMLFQALTLSIVACLTMLGSRSAAVFTPANHAGQYIAERLLFVEQCPPYPKESNISALN